MLHRALPGLHAVSPAAAPAASHPASRKRKAAVDPRAAGEQEAGQSGLRPPGAWQDRCHKAPALPVPVPGGSLALHVLTPVTPSAALQCGCDDPHFTEKETRAPTSKEQGWDKAWASLRAAHHGGRARPAFCLTENDKTRAQLSLEEGTW